MSKFGMSLERATRLRPNRGALDNHVSQIRIGGTSASQIVLLPYSQGLGYFVVPTGGRVRSIEADDFSAESLSLPLSHWVRLRLRLMFKKKKYLEFQDFSLFCYGVRPERKRFTTFNQHMFNTGAALDGRLVTTHPELLQGWAPIEGAKPLAPLTSAPSAAVVAHIYYEDTWPDIAGVLKRLTIPFDLIVTTVPERDRLVTAVARDFPHAEVIVTENRGRDVRPFLELLEAGRLDRYRYVCKIHGKKSNDGGRISYLGALWRRRSLFDLLAGPGIAQAIIRVFEADASVGIIGPRAFRLPSQSSPLEPSWGKTRPRVLELAAKMGVASNEFRLDFYGGTMFWARPEALRPLRNLKLARAFPDEQGLLDGGLEHATERLFTTSAVVAGFALADSDGYEVTHGLR
ncbi:MAG TPA: rhamnan synthesis F family protein [Roseiarcus sp.]